MFSRARIAILVVGAAVTLASATPQDRPDLTYRGAEKRLAEGTFDSAAQSLLDASERFTRLIFQLPSLHFQRAVSYRDRRGDCFVAEWAFGPRNRWSVILADYPDRSVYHFRLSGYRIAVREDVGLLISELVIFRRPPVIVLPDRAELEVEESGGTPVSFSWRYDPVQPIPRPKDQEVRITGVAAPGDYWYVAAEVGKALTAQYYPVKPLLKERFPPLIEMVNSWSFERIRKELLDPYKEDRLGQRREILLAEVARRGISPEQFLELLQDIPSGYEYVRIGELLNALERNGQGNALASLFEPALKFYERKRDRMADSAIAILFVRASKKCSAAFEEHAMRILREGAFAFGPVHYLGACSSSPEALRVVEGLPVSQEQQRWRSSAAQGIRQRLGKASPAGP
jgi:hypothetical protein